MAVSSIVDVAAVALVTSSVLSLVSHYYYGVDDVDYAFLYLYDSDESALNYVAVSDDAIINHHE